MSNQSGEPGTGPTWGHSASSRKASPRESPSTGRRGAEAGPGSRQRDEAQGSGTGGRLAGRQLCSTQSLMHFISLILNTTFQGRYKPILQGRKLRLGKV